MKKLIKILLPVLAITAVSVTAITGIANLGSSASSTYDPDLTIQGRVKNTFDGYLEDVDVYFEDELVDISDENGQFIIASKGFSGDKTITLIKTGFETRDIKISSLSDHLNLQDVDLNYESSYIGNTVSGENSSDWGVSATRSSTDLIFTFTSLNFDFVDSSSILKLYVDTGDVSNKFRAGDYCFNIDGKQNLTVDDFGSVHQKIDYNIFALKFDISLTCLSIELSIPYSFIEIDSTSIIGVNVVDYVSSVCFYNLEFEQEIIDVNDKFNYVRLNKYSETFKNDTNDFNPKWISESEKQLLIDGYPYSFADPKTNQVKDADDFHLKFNYLENYLNVKLIGFGYFEDNEYVQIIIHSSLESYYGWQLDTSDIVLAISNKTIKMYKNVPNFFSVGDGLVAPFANLDIDYTDYGKYFTVEAELPIKLFSNIKDNKQGFSFGAAEFAGSLIYAPINLNEYMKCGDVFSGDIAGMGSYFMEQSPRDVISISEEDRDSLTTGYPISFSNPIDTTIGESDDIFVKLDKSRTTLDYSFVGFGNFQDYESIKFIIHSADTNFEGWAINSTDTSFILTKTSCYLKTNITNYFDFVSQTQSNVKTINDPVFTQFDNYFTITISIKYSEMNNFYKSTLFTTMFLEFNSSSHVYNGGDFAHAMRKEGIPCGDPSNQNNYTTF